jgi:hypothetical protein
MKEALKMALEALKTIDDAMPFPVAKLAIKECTAALEAKDEPVAWVCFGAPGKRDIDFEEADINKLPIGTLLYTTPPQRTWVGLTEQEHITDGGKCWCDPELDYKDPNTGVEVWIHKDLQ